MSQTMPICGIQFVIFHQVPRPNYMKEKGREIERAELIHLFLFLNKSSYIGLITDQIAFIF